MPSRPPRAVTALRSAMLLVLLAIALVVPGVAVAQTPTPGTPGSLPTARPTDAPPQTRTPAPPANGDIVWAFGSEVPLVDGRVAGALGTAMEPFIQDGVAAGTRVVRVEPQGAAVVQVAPVYPAGDVSLLLRAAGYGNTPPFVGVGACRVWSASTQSAALVPRLDAALRKALGALNVAIEPCVTTTNPAEAHVLAWRHGIDPAPAFAFRQQATFLDAPAQLGAPAVPPTQPGGMGGGFPRPATTGTAGPETAGMSSAARVILVIFGVMMVVGGRRITRRK